MMFGGNNRAQVFFKQHGWNDGGKIEAKYTSRAADMYRQTLAKEVAKAMAEETVLPSLSSVATSQPVESSENGFTSESPKESSLKQEAAVVSSPKASQKVVASTFKKPLVSRKSGKTGGLGARKLTTKSKDNLYEQKPEEPVPVIPAASPTNDTSAAGSSFASRFEYFDDEQSGGQSGTRVLSHVAPPKSSNFFNEFGMDSAFPKKSSSSSSKAQVKKSFIFNRTEERDRNQFSIPLCLPVFFLLRLKKQMKQERSFQTPNRFPLPNFSEIRTEMPILTQKLPFRSSRVQQLFQVLIFLATDQMIPTSISLQAISSTEFLSRRSKICHLLLT
jgi:hypothetical protein